MNDADNAREDATLADGTAYGMRLPGDDQTPQLVRDLEDRERGYSLIAAGGWSAPSETLYNLGDLTDAGLVIGFPAVSTARGGIGFPTQLDPDSPEGIAQAAQWEAERAYAEFVRRHIATHIGDTPMAKHDAVHAAVYWARTQGLAWDVHLHTSETSRFVGITVWPSKSGVSTLRSHEVYGDDSWGGHTFDASDWCEMFEDLW